MENFTFLKEVITPEIAVLVRAALIAAFIFGIEALGKVRRTGSERVKVNAGRPKYAERERLLKKRTVI